MIQTVCECGKAINLSDGYMNAQRRLVCLDCWRKLGTGRIHEPTEITVYCSDCAKKDQRIATLESENERLREAIKHINILLQIAVDHFESCEDCRECLINCRGDYEAYQAWKDAAAAAIAVRAWEEKQ